MAPWPPSVLEVLEVATRPFYVFSRHNRNSSKNNPALFLVFFLKSKPTAIVCTRAKLSLPCHHNVRFPVCQSHLILSLTHLRETRQICQTEASHIFLSNPNKKHAKKKKPQHVTKAHGGKQKANAQVRKKINRGRQRLSKMKSIKSRRRQMVSTYQKTATNEKPSSRMLGVSISYTI